MLRNPLGRGLVELLGEGSDNMIRNAPIDKLITNPYQPRQSFDPDQLQELARTIQESGILQPLVVRRKGHEEYEIIAGERRYRAAKLAGLETVPVIVRQANDEQMLALALVENLQREDINPADAAVSYRRLADEFGLTQEQIADRVGKSRGQIANSLRLLNLPANMFESVRLGKITEGHARALLTLGEKPALQSELHRQIVDEGLSVREAERRSQFFRNPPSNDGPIAVVPPADPNWLRLEETLSERLGTKIQIIRVGVGGRIQIPFYDEQDLSRILERLGHL
jgi:ParB family chromosome partitioning protein